MLKVFVVAPPHETFCLQELQTAYFVSSATGKKDQIGDDFLEVYTNHFSHIKFTSIGVR